MVIGKQTCTLKNNLTEGNGKAVPETVSDGPRGFHILLDSRFIDGGEVFSLTRRPLFTTQEDS
jgi:hypothetical protein